MTTTTNNTLRKKQPDTKKIIGELIKKHRLEKQLTQQQLADMLNVDRQYIWKIENGHINLTLDYLDKIITKLNCKHSHFFNKNKQIE